MRPKNTLYQTRLHPNDLILNWSSVETVCPNKATFWGTGGSNFNTQILGGRNWIHSTNPMSSFWRMALAYSLLCIWNQNGVRKDVLAN